MNEWVTVRREERAIYSQRQIQPFRYESKVPTQIAETSDSTKKHCSHRQSTGLARISSELPAIAGTSGSRDFGFRQDFRQTSGLPASQNVLLYLGLRNAGWEGGGGKGELQY